MQFTFDNITVKPCTLDDVDALQAIISQQDAFFGSQDVGLHMASAYDCLTKGSLPPNGRKEKYHMLGIYCNGSMCGNLEYYEGYPENDTAYLSLLYLAEPMRGRGVGTEICRQVFSRLAAQGFARVKLAVSVRNPLGLQFWPMVGFTQIEKVSFQSRYVCLEMVKDL